MPHLQFGEIVETRHFTTSEPPNTYDHEANDKRHEQPSLDWQRRWQIHKLHKHNRQTTTKLDYPQWYLDNPTEYNTPKRPLPETTAPETYIHDPDFNCDPYHNPKIYDKTTLTFKQREVIYQRQNLSRQPGWTYQQNHVTDQKPSNRSQSTTKTQHK